MSTLGPDGRALFRSARRDLAPTDTDRARMDRVFATKLGLAAGAAATLATKSATASTPPAAAAATSTTALVAAKVVGVLAILGAGGSAALYITDSTPPVAHVASAPLAARSPLPPAPVAAPAEPTIAPVVAPLSPPRVEPTTAPVVPSFGPRDLPLVTSARRSSPVPPASTTPAAAGTVAAETRLLREADAALRGGDAVSALALLDELARTYPNGVLREERSAERIFALCKLGRVDEARSEGSRFLHDNSESPLAASVRSSCGGASNGP